MLFIYDSYVDISILDIILSIIAIGYVANDDYKSIILSLLLIPTPVVLWFLNISITPLIIIHWVGIFIGAIYFIQQFFKFTEKNNLGFTVIIFVLILMVSCFVTSFYEGTNLIDSFGVVTGKILASYLNYKYIIIFGLLLIPLSFIVHQYNGADKTCDKFYYHNDKYPVVLIILLGVFVVVIRGYIGYGIPSSWNKSMFDTFLLYSFMGVGKAMGGILIDSIGIRKTIFISSIVSLPFLCFR